MKVKVTEQNLRDLGACDAAIEALRPLLPATMSDDPEENLHLANQMANLPAPYWEARFNPAWLANAVSTFGSFGYARYGDGEWSCPPDEQDLSYTAGRLAEAALLLSRYRREH